jgi:uncharacterized repeat protein (TIGR01451 family)
MQLFKQQIRRTSFAVVALGLIGVTPTAFAAGTDFSTPITNTASVNYSVSGVPQAAIGSSPTGNSAGAGTPTSFVVDKKISFVAEETNGTATVTGPSVTQVVTVFKVSNTSNGVQEFRLEASNTLPSPLEQIFTRDDSFNMVNFSIHVSAAACDIGTTVTPTFAGEPATTYLPAVPEDDCNYVFVVADTPAASPTVANGLASTIQLRVRPSNTNGTVLEAESGAADLAGTVDVVFAESGTDVDNQDYDGISLAYDQYLVGTLTVTKTADVISDGISPAGEEKAIPGAVVEYTIIVRNDGLATSGAQLMEAIPANTAYVAGSTTLNGVAVSDISGAMPYVSGGPINSTAAAAGVINPYVAPADRAVVTFRVTIQ